MEICGQNQLQTHSTRINIRISDYKTADDCDCEFIKPVSGYECQLCNIFLRNGYKIKEHIKTFQHMKIYEIHLQEHFQHRHGINTNQRNVTAQKSADSHTKNKNDTAKGYTAINDLKRNLVNDHGIPEKSEQEVSTTELNRRRTDLNGVIKRLHESGTRNQTRNIVNNRRVTILNNEPGPENSAIDNGRITVLNDEPGTRNRTQRVVDNSRIAVLNDESATRNRKRNLADNREIKVLSDELTMRNRDDLLHRHQGKHYSDLAGVQSSLNNENFVESSSRQNSEDLSEICSTMNEIEKEASSEERLVKHDDDDVINIDVNAKVSTITEHGGTSENGEMKADAEAYLEGEQLGACQVDKIKEEECDRDDVDDDGGVIGGFLEESNDVLHNQNEYCNGEIMPGYRIDSQTVSTMSFSSKQISAISIPAADSSVRAEETCTVTTSVSDNPWPSFVSLESERRERFGGNLVAENSENDGDVNKSGDKISSVKELRPNHYQSLHRRIGEKLLSCFVCGKLFTQSGDLKKHERVHTGEKPYSCEFCGMHFATSGNCDRHKRIHTGERPFSCDICGKGFKQRQNVNIHKRVHFGNKPFSCEFCGKEFTKISTYEFHIMTHTTGERQFSCNICDKSFKSSRYLEMHQEKHGSVEPLLCSVCGKSFAHAGNLRAHERIHTGEKPYSCDQCDMSFSRSSNCIRHKRTHTREKPYWCYECGKLFTDKEALRIHLRVHTGDGPPHPCNVCGQLFKDEGFLKLHEETHTGEKTFTCEVCGRTFQSAVVLKRHESIQHS